MSKKSWQLSRRTMLTGIGATVCLPWLEAMESESKASDTPASPARMAFLYFPNGIARGSWNPAKSDQNGNLVELNEWMHPLESLKDDLLVFKNLWTPRGNGHRAGTATWLTGGEYDGGRVSAGGKSVDQLAADEVGQQTLLPSLQISIEGEGFFSGSLPRNTISWTDNRTPASREVEPRVVFDQMFRTSTTSGIDKGVVDQVREQARSIRQQLGKSDQRKIDEYLDSIRSIERRLAFADRQAEIAAENKLLTDTLKRPAPGIPTDHREYMRLMMDMIVLGFWADATRISTFMLDHGQSNRYFNFIDDVKGTWHALSHYRDISGRTEDDDGVTSWKSLDEKRDMFNRVTRWHHEQLAYMLNRMKEIDEGEHTLLDNSMIVYGSSLADGHEHSHEDLPVVFAGGSNLDIKTGRYLRFRDDVPMSNLYLSMLNRMGVEQKRFGASRGPLDDLRG